MGGLVLLYGGGEAVVRGSASLGLRLGMSPLLTGLTIVAFGTSAPELMVSLQAALRGESGLAVGNVVGSNICNIGLILGFSALIRPTRIDSQLVRREVPVMVAGAALLWLLMLDGYLSRVEGGLLFALMLAYLTYTIRASRSGKRAVVSQFRDAIPSPPLSVQKAILLTVLGLAALSYGGQLFVRGAIVVSGLLGVAPAVIGLSVAAVGTSLPELATSIVAAYRGFGDMAIGNVIGSNIFNTLSVLGITALAIPLGRGAVTNIDLGVMMLASLVVLPMMSTRARMERWEGALLMTGFLGYMLWLFI
jgi:cation:H+ antiporter